MFRLALSLGKSIREIERFDALEIAEWMAFSQLEPFGDEWRQSAMQVAALFNCHASKGKSFREEQFMPLKTRYREQDPAETKARFMLIAGAHNQKCRQT